MHEWLIPDHQLRVQSDGTLLMGSEPGKAAECFSRTKAALLPKDAYYILPESCIGNSIRLLSTENGWMAAGSIPAGKVQKADLKVKRVCVLLNTTMVNEKWIKTVLKKEISRFDRVCVVAASYFDDTKTNQDWLKQYGEKNGCWRASHQNVFYDYGLRPGQIVWINPFEDSPQQMKEKILSSSILLLPGGAPDLFMQRLKKMKLTSLLRKYQGLIIGCSAGSMIQLDEYHISPDEDYPEFSWNKGLGYIKGVDIEAHYKASNHQKRCIEKAQAEKPMPVYALYENGGLLVDETGSLHSFGQTELFEAPGC